MAKGFREKMLCRACEDRLSKWEAYAAQILFGAVEIGIKKTQNALIVRDVDYGKFKLFQLSLLWRGGANVEGDLV